MALYDGDGSGELKLKILSPVACPAPGRLAWAARLRPHDKVAKRLAVRAYRSHEQSPARVGCLILHRMVYDARHSQVLHCGPPFR